MKNIDNLLLLFLSFFLFFFPLCVLFSFLYLFIYFYRKHKFYCIEIVSAKKDEKSF